MSFNIGEAFDYINSLVKLNVNVTKGMENLLNYCRKQYKSSVWDAIQNMSFYEDEQNISKWLQDTLENEPPCEAIEAFWFGLFDSLIDDKEICVLYFSGVNPIDEKDAEEDDEYEPEYEPVYEPGDGYADSKILYDMSVILKGEGGKASEIGEYVLYLGYAALVINSILSSLDKEILISLKIPSRIMVGFDSGDYINLSVINN